MQPESEQFLPRPSFSFDHDRTIAQSCPFRRVSQRSNRGTLPEEGIGDVVPRAGSGRGILLRSADPGNRLKVHVHGTATVC